ncbi:RNA polymerase sigma factor [Crocinitomix algicola]|uniref:RNA polymerase sigma factor n=1 Tax=Crocinitomix algicola TaxID=1740263 RepID=UPI0008727378|nr:RNA polymerase sigma factor [Crocinitomix algicola]
MSKTKQIAFLKLYEPVHERFERFCRVRVYGDGDYRDLMHETLLKAFEKFETLRSEKAFLSFLFSIAIRILSNQNRKRKVGRWDSDEEANRIIDCNADSSQRLELTVFYEILGKLPDDQRESLILFEISGFSIREVAELQNSSESAVKQRLRRGRLKLKELYSTKYLTIDSE